MKPSRSPVCKWIPLVIWLHGLFSGYIVAVYRESLWLAFFIGISGWLVSHYLGTLIADDGG